MALTDDLKRLAKLPISSSSPFLTLYLRTRWDSEKQRERVRIFVKTKLKECLSGNEYLDPESRQGMQEDAEKMEHYARGVVNREWDENYRGIAVFACSSFGVYEVVRSHMPFREAFTCADRPLLRQAVEHAHAGEQAILALLSSDTGRILEFELGGVRREFSFTDEEFPSRHEQGGWSQSRFQRHVDEHMQRNLKRLAGHLVKWADERRVRRILLSGQVPLLAAFEAQLPKRVADSVCSRIHIDSNASPDVIQSEALEALRIAREQDSREAVDWVLDKGIGMGRAIAGPEAVADAAGSGRVHEIYLDSDFRGMSWSCSKCGSIKPPTRSECQLCGSPVEEVDLGEELVRQTLMTDGKVVTVNGHPGLREAGGVAAVLRYA